MKNHPPILILVPFIAIACYLGWSLVSGSVRVRGIAEPITRQGNPQKYWSYMGLFLAIFAVLAASFIWFFS
jgi:hypothetical protein